MANAQSIYMESTSVPVSRTVAEIVELLQRTPGVVEITQRMSPDGLRVQFGIEANDQLLTFELRPDVRGIQRCYARFHPNANDLDRGRAERIAWRQIGEWVKVEIALIEAGQRDLVTAFLPHLLIWKDGRRLTMAQEFIEQRLLTAPAADTATTEAQS